MNKVRRRYKYKGPVMEFDRLICHNWEGETVATSESEAKKNLAYQFKMKYNRTKTAKISLHGKVTELEAVM